MAIPQFRKENYLNEMLTFDLSPWVYFRQVNSTNDIIDPRSTVIAQFLLQSVNRDIKEHRNSVCVECCHNFLA